MKAFRFRADILLALRRRQQESVQAALTDAQMIARETAGRLAQASAATQVASDRYAAALRVERDPAVFERHRNWIAGLRLDVQRIEVVLADETLAVMEAADALRRAHQRVRVLERLRERTWQRYALATRRQDMKDIDDIATLQFARRLVQGGHDRDC